jgi:hypothetical protein
MAKRMQGGLGLLLQMRRHLARPQGRPGRARVPNVRRRAEGEVITGKQMPRDRELLGWTRAQLTQRGRTATVNTLCDAEEEHETAFSPERSLRQGKLRRHIISSRPRGHLAIGVVLFLLALAGWGAFAQSVRSRQKLERDMHRDVSRLTVDRDRDVSRLTVDRDRALEQQRTLASELETSKAELAAAQRGISGLISALEKSRAELSALKLGAAPEPVSTRRPSR